MRGITAKDRQENLGVVKLAIVAPAMEDGLKYVVIHISKPGDYRIALPTAEQARELVVARPEGKLKLVGDVRLWIEPITPGRA